jgi:hypothetical protein
VSGEAGGGYFYPDSEDEAVVGTGKHRPRDAPYPDELDQQFCEEDGTLCYPGRPCVCCWVAATEAEESS